jgi:predicted DNA-binding protein
VKEEIPQEGETGKVKQISVSVRLPVDIYEAVKAISMSTGRSMAAQTLQLIELALVTRSTQIISIEAYRRLLMSLVRPPIDLDDLQSIAIDCRLTEKEIQKMEAIAHALSI